MLVPPDFSMKTGYNLNMTEYIHRGGFGNSEAGRPLAFGVAVDKNGNEIKLQGVRVRNARAGNPYITTERAGERIKAVVNPDDSDLVSLLAFLAEAA